MTGFRKKSIIIILFMNVFLVSTTGFAANQWTNYTNADRVYDTFRDGDALWCATIGGLVKWNLRDSTYTKYTAIEGLPDLTCSSIVLDANGLLWIASAGLTSFDGSTFTNYPSYEGHPLGGWGDIETAQNGIWVKTNNGIVSILDGEWKYFDSADGLGSTIHDIDIDNSGMVWAATTQGLYFNDGYGWIRKEGLPYEEVMAVTHDRDGNIYAGSRKSLPGPEVYYSSIGAVSRFDGIDWLTYNLTGEAPWQYSRSLCVFGDTLFISKSNTISALDARTMQPLNGNEHLFDLTSDEIYADEFGEIWLSTWTGLYKLDGGTLVKYPMDDGIAHPCINDIAVDSEGNTWIASNGGVSCFDGTSWQSYTVNDGLYSNEVRSIAAGLNGEVWTTHYNGVSHFNGQTWDNAKNAFIGGEIGVDRNGIAWIGSTHESHLLRYNGSFFQDFTIPVDIHYNPFYDIEFDSGGNIWCATYNGIARFTYTIPQGWEIITTDHGLPDNVVNDIAFDKNGNIWAATRKGLAFWDHTTWTVYTELGNYIQAVSVAPDGVVWVASTEGLTCITSSGWHTFKREDGLINNSISDIAITPDGVVWASNSSPPIGGGLSRLIPDPSTSVEDSAAPQPLALRASAYPNPFNPVTTIEYFLPEASHVHLTVYSITGQSVITIADDFIAAGTHTAVFDGSNQATGIYFYRLESRGKAFIGKMMLLK